MKALILGAFDTLGEEQFRIGGPREVISLTTNGRSLDFYPLILKQFRVIGPLKKAKSRLLVDLNDEYPVIVLMNLQIFSSQAKDRARILQEALVEGFCRITTQKKVLVTEVVVDDCGDTQFVSLTLHALQWHLNKAKDEQSCRTYQFSPLDTSVNTMAAWERGRILANGYVNGRSFEPNLITALTPFIFARQLAKVASDKGVMVIARSNRWSLRRSMNEYSRLREASFVELRYSNATPEQSPIILVGVGVICRNRIRAIPRPFTQESRKALLSDAAVVASTIISFVDRKSKVNAIGLIPCIIDVDKVRADDGKRVLFEPEVRRVLGEVLPYALSKKNRAVMTISSLNESITGDRCGWYASDLTLHPLFQRLTEPFGDKVFSTYDSTCAFIRDYNKDDLPRIYLAISQLEWAVTPQLCLSAGVCQYPLNLIIPFVEAIFRENY